MEPSAELTFWEHIGSLRTHLLFAAAIFVAIAGLAFTAADPLTHLLLRPLHGQQLIFLSVLGPLLFKMKVAFLVAFIASVPPWIALIGHFIAPALRTRQRLMVGGFAAAAGLLGGLAAIVSYVYLVPTSLAVLLTMSVDGTSVVLTADSYLDFFFLETITAFVIFQLPLVINLLAFLGLVDPRNLGRKRPILYIVLLAVLAIVTPTTDVVSLVVVFLPAVVFLEAGLVIAQVVHRRHA